MSLVLVILVLWLSVVDPASADTFLVAGAAPAIAAPAIRPLDVVASSVSRGRAADDLFDVSDLARRALGQHWKELGPRERDEFVRLFRDVVTRSFVTIVERYTGDNAASLDETVVGPFARVRSRTTAEHGSQSAVEYRLSRSDAQWTVYDIVLDGASLVASYRSQFHAILGTSSVAQLLEHMRTERARRPPSSDAVDGATLGELDSAARRRLVAGLLVGAAARWMR